MIRTDPRSCTRWRFLPHPFWLFLLFSFTPSLPAFLHAQTPEKPLQNIDEDITAFAYAADGRIVYSVNRGFKTKQYDLEHDDVWIQEAAGKRRRIFVGDKFLQGNTPFTYNVNSLRWSPNERRILAELRVATIDETGKTVDSTQTLVLEDTGKEVKSGGNEKLIKDADNPTWLLDNATVIYLTELVKPKVLFSFRYLNTNAGPSGPVFEGRTFLDSVRVPRSNLAIAVERDRSLTGPPRLQRLELLTQDDHELATLDDFSGGLSLSPSGSKVAYYLDKEVLEIRDLSDLKKVARVRIGFGVYRWAPDETRLLLKRSIEKKSGDLVWIDLPELTAHAGTSEGSVPISQPVPIPLFRGNTIRDFAISPDGRMLAVIWPGHRNLSVYPLPSR
jgi:dipeptidyl aminopeptidase/acylaminoacyl peptidase